MRTIIRILVVPFLAGAVVITVAAAGAVDAGLPQKGQQATPAEPTRAQRLDTLFARLKRESDPDVARKTADEIWAIWRDSGSPTVDLLMEWTDKAVAAKQYGKALDLLDEITVLDPGFAEGWNRRATVHYMMNDYAKSMADIDRTLSLEPRHFGALSGMAGILAASGKDELALDALQRVLDVYPANRAAQEQLGKLADKLSGESI